eukprot:6196056-Pleurochrysis_carterae.AAC.1
MPPRAGGPRGAGWGPADEWPQLAAGGPAESDWLACIDTAEHLLEQNEGVPIAPRRVFRAPEERGTILATSDASGVDG